jgi:hypothetical protein
MFEFLYAGHLFQLAKDNPREAAALIAAVVIIPGMHQRYTQVQLAKIRSANDVEIARLEKETAELNYKTAQLFEANPTSN